MNEAVSRTNRRRIGIALAMVAAVALQLPATKAHAANLTTSAGGPVSVEFTFASADFINTMSVTSPVNQFLFDTEKTRIGTRVNLGNFASGTAFQFQMVATTGSGTFTWSSDPSQNSDGKDHLRTTELFDGDATLDNRVYKLEWEDEPDLGDGDFNDAVAVLRIGADSDGDGLFDDWERNGIDGNNDGDTLDPGERDLPNGIDQNGDGDTTDVGERADPRHLDVFLEMDWMDCTVAGSDCAAGDTHSHRPQNASVANVVQAFRNAPVTNLDGVNGINLHLQLSNAVAHQNVLNFNGGALGCGPNPAGTGFGDFDTVKAANFDNAAARRYAFHYALAIDVENQAALTDATQRFSGCGEILGNDFYISFGLWGPITVQQEAGTIMHELGHNLGLQHGGNDTVNFKPNYLSLMNYSFQLRGIPATNRLDYSAGALPTLNEGSLNENVGVQDGTDNTLFTCPGGAQSQVAASGPVDWNCNGTLQASVSADINGAAGTSLTGFNDWAQVVASLPFQADGDFQDGVHPNVVDDPELDRQTAETRGLLTTPPDIGPVATHSGQYSDPITPYTLSATDSDSACSDVTFSAIGLPSGLVVTSNGDCTGIVSGTLAAAAGSYAVTYTATDETGASDSTPSSFQVTREDATVTPSASNPKGVVVSTAGGSASFALSAAVTEPDASKGDIGLATPVTFTLTPLESGSSYSCTATTSGGGVGGTLLATCNFSGVAVNAYTVDIVVGGSYYQGSGQTIVAVGDPSLGFFTGGAKLGSAKAELNPKYKKDGSVQGKVSYSDSSGPGTTLESTRLDALVVMGQKAYVLGSATVNGTSGYSFILTVIDNGEPGRDDRLGLAVRDPGGNVVPGLTFSPRTLTGGNLQQHG
ncbi:MAG: hypothetical protein QOI56_797 [Actinomycetota bacterium]|nr:hypothetical protein [Actinomycetota bacterium]